MSDQALVQQALELGYVNDADVATAMERQAELGDRGVERSLWLLLQDLEAIKPEHARSVERGGSVAGMDALEVQGYVIQGRLGRGGMGDVFLGSRADGAEAAIKLLPQNLVDDIEYVSRFQREVEALKVLRHPHITGHIGDGEVDGRPYLIMDLIRGQSLKERLQTQGAISESEARQMLRQLAGALEHAYRVGELVHRDVKPANILLSTTDDGIEARLCDFGLAKFIGRKDETRIHGDLTHSGVAIGTPHYMSPEQATGDRSADPRHDIYGLGATIYHALLGKTLYSGGSSAVIMYKQATAALDMKPLTRLGIAPAFVEVLRRMLAKPRERRYSSWPEVLAEADRLELVPLAEESADAIPEAPKPVNFLEQAEAENNGDVGSGRRGLGVVPLVLGTVAVIALIAGFSLHWLANAEVVRQYQAGPGDLGHVIAEARTMLRRHGGSVTVELAAGAYAGGFRFGPEDSGLQVVAEPGQVVLTGERGRPVLQLADGLENFSLRGLTIRDATAAAIESRAVSASLKDCRVEDSYLILDQHGGSLRIEGFHASHCGHGVRVTAVSDAVPELFVYEAVLSVGQEHIVADNAAITLRRLRCVGEQRQDAPVISCQGGVCSIRGLIIEGSGSWTGLDLRNVGHAEIAEVRIDGGSRAVHAEGTVLSRLVGLSAHVSDVGLWWSGEHRPEWKWQRLFMTAGIRLQGLDERALQMIFDEIGADQAVLDLVPTADK